MNENEISLPQLRAELESLRLEVSALRSELKLQAQPDPLAGVASSAVDEKHSNFGRRSLIGTAAAAVAGAVAFPKQAAADGSSGTALQSNMFFGATDIAPQPIDTSISWRRNNPSNDSAGYVRSVLALQQEGRGQNSYPWTLFVKNTATDSTSATQTSANAYGVNARGINPGSGHASVFFSDLQHGDATRTTASGETLGYDCEIIRSSPNGRVIGLNVANVGDPQDATSQVRTRIDVDQAINVQTTQYGGIRRGFKTGILFEHVTTETSQSQAGDRGIWMKANFGVGLDMENNNIKLNRGAKIFFDENQTLYMWLNPANTRLEIRYLNNVLGYLPLNATPHQL